MPKLRGEERETQFTTVARSVQMLVCIPRKMYTVFFFFAAIAKKKFFVYIFLSVFLTTI